MGSAAAQRRSRWLDRLFEEFVRDLNGEPVFGLGTPPWRALDERDVSAIGSAWFEAAALIRSGASPEVALRDLVRVVTIVQRDGKAIPFLTADGHLLTSYATPRADAYGAIAVILDHAAKTGRYKQILARLRVCTDCWRFVHDERGQRTLCSAKCRRLRDAPGARQRQQRARERERDAHAQDGLGAPPGRCLSERLLDPAGQRERHRILVASGMTDWNASDILDREVERTESLLKSRTSRPLDEKTP